MLHFNGQNMKGTVPPTTGQIIEEGCPEGSFRSPGPEYDLLLREFGFRQNAQGCWMIEPPKPEPKAPPLQPQPSARQPATAPSSGASSAREREFLSIINNYRRQHGIHPLTMNRHLTKAARWHSEVMRQTGQVSHVIPGHPYGESVYDRAPKAGYEGSGIGENIAFRSTGFSPQEAFIAWKNSPSHNKQMLDPDWYVIGVGDGNTMWTTVFGNMRDGAEEAEPAGAVESKWGGARMKAGPQPKQPSAPDLWSAHSPAPQPRRQAKVAPYRQRWPMQ